VRFQGRRYSYVDGEFRIDPRRLPLQYQVLKGYEYGIAGGELTASAARGGSFTIPPARPLVGRCGSGMVQRRHSYSSHLSQNVPARDGR
jgi:hypothetical protein